MPSQSSSDEALHEQGTHGDSGSISNVQLRQKRDNFAKQHKRTSQKPHDRKSHRKSRERMSLLNNYKDGSSFEGRRAGTRTKVYSNPSDGSRRVVSCLELNVPDHTDLQYSQSEDKSSKLDSSTGKRRSRHRDSRGEPIKIPFKSLDEGLNMRQTGIFIPELRRKRHSHQPHRYSRSKSELNHQSLNSICAHCMQGRCNHCGRPMSLGRPMSNPNLSYNSTDPFPHSGYYSDDPDNDYDKPITDVTDKMQIEFIPDEEIGDQVKYLDETAQRLIVQSAKETCKRVEHLDGIAKVLKISLDDHLGPKWHVVVGRDTYGSHFESIPGAMVHFKVEGLVFLAWQT